MVLRQVCTTYGVIEGLAADDPEITVFRGVPFAAPPVGELRWRAPQPLQSWKGILHAHDFGPSAMQPRWNPEEFYGREWQVDPDSPRSEDCLYVNIWTPALVGSGEARLRRDIGHGCGKRPEDASCMPADSRHGLLPVMVWIHGGAYQCGTPAEKEFDGSALARLGVVVVSVAYRMNAFGFFTHPDLQREAELRAAGGVPEEPYANFGLLDQRAAILWVQGNIAAFGGDPASITVFGQSAGAASVLSQICSPLNQGLFHRAIMQSGAGIGLFNMRLRSLEEAQHNAIRFLDFLGVPSVREARRISADALLDAAEHFPAPEDAGLAAQAWPMPANWMPCVDGRMLPGQYGDILRRGAQQPVDIIIGNTTGEFLETQADGTVMPAGEQGNMDLIRAWISGGANPPYYYRFDVDMPGDSAGAFHSSELWFTFNSLARCWRPFSGWHYELADMMSRYWANFAITGNPNGVRNDGTPLPQWSCCGSDGIQFAAMRFAVVTGMESDGTIATGS